MENLGFLAALGAALAWGSYTVPFKKSQSKNLMQFQALMGVGILLSGILFSLILGYPLTLNIYGLVSGFLWAVANAISLIALSNLGLSRAVPLMGSIVMLGSFLWGTLVFKEISTNLTGGFIGIGLLIIGVVLVSSTTKAFSQNIKKGTVAAILAALIWGSQLAPLKIGHLTPRDFFFPSCLGIFITAVLIALVSKLKFKKEAIVESLLSGAIWNVGNLLSVIAIAMIGLAKGQPISLSSSLVGVLWGLIYFKEVTQAKKRLQILIGTIVLILGVIVLGLA